jgi:hypothetical protein
MKTIITTFTFTLFLIAGLNAQTTTIPTYKNNIIILKTTTFITNDYLTISDGETVFTLQLMSEEYYMKKEEANKNLPVLTNVMNQLSAQGYKIITSTTAVYGSTNITKYIFQKE